MTRRLRVGSTIASRTAGIPLSYAKISAIFEEEEDFQSSRCDLKHQVEMGTKEEILCLNSINTAQALPDVTETHGTKACELPE